MTTQPPAQGTTDPGGGAASNAGYSLLAHLVSGALTAGLILFFARALGPQDYGLFTLSIAIGVLLLRPADLGLTGATARFIAERRGEPLAIARILADALVLRLGLNLLALAALLALAGVIAGWLDEPELAGPLRVIALALVGHSTMLLFAAVFIAVGRTSRMLVLFATEGTIEVAASVLLVLAGAGVGGAAAGRAIGYLAGAAIGLALAVRLLGRPHFGDPDVPTRRRLGRLARYGGVLLVVDSTYTAFNQVGTLVIGAVLGSGAVGLYAAPLQLCVFLHNLGLAISDGVSPRLAHHRSRPADLRAFGVAMRLLVLLQLALAVPILVWAEPIVALLLGPEFAASADVLRVLGAFVFVQGFGPLLSGAANFRGLAGRRCRCGAPAGR
jgi:O-antigen/teichoic acid export membrane protein